MNFERTLFDQTTPSLVNESQKFLLKNYNAVFSYFLLYFISLLLYYSVMFNFFIQVILKMLS